MRAASSVGIAHPMVSQCSSTHSPAGLFLVCELQPEGSGLPAQVPPQNRHNLARHCGLRMRSRVQKRPGGQVMTDDARVGALKLLQRRRKGPPQRPRRATAVHPASQTDNQTPRIAPPHRTHQTDIVRRERSETKNCRGVASLGRSRKTQGKAGNDDWLQLLSDGGE